MELRFVAAEENSEESDLYNFWQILMGGEVFWAQFLGTHYF